MEKIKARRKKTANVIKALRQSVLAIIEIVRIVRQRISIFILTDLTTKIKGNKEMLTHVHHIAKRLELEKFIDKQNVVAYVVLMPKT